MQEILHAMSRPVSAISESWAGQFYEHGAGETKLFKDLVDAVVCQNISQLKAILNEHGGSIENLGSTLYKQNFLHTATLTSSPSILNELLKKKNVRNILLDSKNPVGLTPLMLASSRGSLRCVQILLGLGADPNVTDNNGDTALVWAVRNGHGHLMKTLIKTTNSIEDHRSLLLLAVWSGNTACYKRIVQFNKTFRNLLGVNGESFIHVASKNGHAALLKILLSIIGSRTFVAKPIKGMTPLMLAVKSTSTECVLQLLVFGASVEEFNNEKNVTPLHLATQLGQLEMMQLLLMSQECRSRLFMSIKNIKTKFKFLLDKKTILKNAWDGKIFLEDLLVLYGKEGCEMIAELKKDPNNRSVLQNRSGRDVKIIMKYSSKRNCLHLAAQSGNVQALEILYCCFLDIESDIRDIKFNCDKYLNMRNEKMLTPLHYAALSGSMSCTQFLIENGANLMSSIRTGGKFSRQSSGIAAVDLILKYVPEGPEMIHDIFSSCVTLGDEDEDGYKDVNLNMKVCYQPIGKKMDVLERLYENRGRRGSALETLFRLNITVVPPVLSMIALFGESRPISCLALIFSWLSLLLYSNILPVFSKHSAMLQHILRRMTVTMVMLTYVLIGFTLTFYFLYRDLNPNNFGNIWSAFLSTTLVLLNGGLDGSALFMENERDTEVVAGLIHIVFLVTVVLALMNMLLALAIRGGHELEDQGLISELRNKVNLIASMEKVFDLFGSRFGTASNSLERNNLVLHINEENISFELYTNLRILARHVNFYLDESEVGSIRSRNSSIVPSNHYESGLKTGYLQVRYLDGEGSQLATFKSGILMEKADSWLPSSQVITRMEELRYAVLSEQVNVVRTLLKKVTERELHEYSEMANSFPIRRPLLHIAVLKKCPVILKLLLDKRIFQILINERDAEYYTPLMRAADVGSGECVRLLMDAGANTTLSVFKSPDDRYRSNQTSKFVRRRNNTATSSGTTATHIAAEGGYVDVLSLLVQKLDVRQGLEDPDSLGRTPLMVAVENGHVGCFNLLVSVGARYVDVVDYKYQTVLHLSAKKGETEMLRELLRKPEVRKMVNDRDKQSFTALSWSVYNGNVDCMDELLDAGADQKVKDANNNTLLHLACFQGHSHVLKGLLPYSLRFMKSTPQREEVVSLKKNPSSLSSMLTSHEDILDLRNRTRPSGRTVYWWYMRDLKQRNKQGSNCFHLASTSGDVKCLELLLSCFASPGHTDLGEIVCPDIREVDGFGLTPLYISARAGSAECVKFLIDYGGNLAFSSPVDSHNIIGASQEKVLDVLFQNVDNFDHLISEVLDECVDISTDIGSERKFMLDLSVLCPEGVNKMAVTKLLYEQNRCPSLKEHPLILAFIQLECWYVAHPNLNESTDPIRWTLMPLTILVFLFVAPLLLPGNGSMMFRSRPLDRYRPLSGHSPPVSHDQKRGHESPDLTPWSPPRVDKEVHDAVPVGRNILFEECEGDFYPLNCTCVVYPLDLVVIKCFKQEYRNQLVQRAVCLMDTEKGVQLKIDILQTIHFVVSAWQQVTHYTIQECFVKCDHVTKDEGSDVTEIEGRDDDDC
uniref:DDE-1 domain-containing protein n=1 Tax=Timema bartmani TaxID=61472 RepID=A0A7R9ERI2_9NEOP|nr:unnamed protein product [Timema bartmani]